MDKIYKYWFSSFIVGKNIAFPVGMWVVIFWCLAEFCSYTRIPDPYWIIGFVVMTLITIFGRGRRYYL